MFVALSEKHAFLQSHDSGPIKFLATNVSLQYTAKSVFFQAYHNVSVKKPEVFEKCLKSACDDHFSKMQDTARNNHFKKKKPRFCLLQQFLCSRHCQA